jgi:hypothetical protein
MIGGAASLAAGAGNVSVLLHASRPRLTSSPRELVGNCLGTPEVHLVRRLPVESTVRHRLIVLSYIRDTRQFM